MPKKTISQESEDLLSLPAEDRIKGASAAIAQVCKEWGVTITVNTFPTLVDVVQKEQ